jgi:hypothetical protein
MRTGVNNYCSMYSAVLFVIQFKYFDTETQESVHFTFWLRIYRCRYKTNIFPVLLVRRFDGMYVPDIAHSTIIGECEMYHFFVK